MAEPVEDDRWDGLVFLEPRSDLDKAIIGVAERGTEEVLVYSRSKLIDAFVAQGMTLEEAFDWYGFNTIWPQVARYPFFLMDDDDDLDITAIASG